MYGVRVWLSLASACLLHHVKGEGADLLNSVNGNLLIQSFVPPLLDQVIVHFPSTEQHLKKMLHMMKMDIEHPPPS